MTEAGSLVATDTQDQKNDQAIGDIYKTKVCEMTINTRKLIRDVKSNKKATGAIKNLKKFIQKRWKSDAPVYIDEKLNNKIWERGNRHTVGRMRISVEYGFCKTEGNKRCFHVSLIETRRFKRMKDTSYFKDLEVSRD